MTRLAIALASLVLGATSIASSARQVADGVASIRSADHFVVEYSGQEQTLEAAVRAVGGRIDRVHAGVGLAKIGGLSDEQAAVLAAMRGVRSVTRDVIVRWLPRPQHLVQGRTALPAGTAPQGHDPTGAFFFPIQWNMHVIGADAAWNAGFLSRPSVRVAVLDTGIDPFHIDLVGLVDAGSSVAFTPSDNPAGPPWGDDHFHGTHIAGTIVTNGIGTSGVAPHTTLIAVKVLDRFETGTFADVIAGIIHAADVQVDVINMSLGVGFPKNLPGAGRLVGALNRAVNYASAKGVLVVSAGGNDATDLTYIGNITAVPCESGAGICVSSTGPTDQLASYSNFGRAINLAGPGGDFIVTGNFATSTVLAPCSSLSLVLPPCQANGFYLFLQGTSMATAHVSGAAALLDSQHGGSLNGGQLKSRLQQTADDLGGPGADPFFGHGRVNVLDAVMP